MLGSTVIVIYVHSDVNVETVEKHLHAYVAISLTSFQWSTICMYIYACMQIQ